MHTGKLLQYKQQCVYFYIAALLPRHSMLADFGLAHPLLMSSSANVCLACVSSRCGNNKSMLFSTACCQPAAMDLTRAVACELLKNVNVFKLRLQVTSRLLLCCSKVLHRKTMCKAVKDPDAYLFCAAVLRRLLREQELGTLPDPPLPDTSTPQDTAAEMLAVATSHPTWMVKRWLQRWGQQETMSLLAHNNRSTHSTGLHLSSVLPLICRLVTFLTCLPELQCCALIVT